MWSRYADKNKIVYNTANSIYESKTGQKTCTVAATNWKSWSDCSTACDSGIQTRTRTCVYNSGTSIHESKTNKKLATFKTVVEIGDHGQVVQKHAVKEFKEDQNHALLVHLLSQKLSQK